MSDWIFHKDCIHYDSVVKTPMPERKHPKMQLIECKHSGRKNKYYCDRDFECIKTKCQCYEPIEPTLFDFMEE